jgi:RNA polymerase sigma-70 factor, ECF subfamily
MSQKSLYDHTIYRQKTGAITMIDPVEKDRLFEEILAKYDWWLNMIARQNAPINSSEDLEQEIQMAFWQSLDSYDGPISGLPKRFFSVAIVTSNNFRRKERRMRRHEENLNPNSVFVEPERDQLGIIEEFKSKLGKMNRKIFTLYLDSPGYGKMSEELGVNEVALRKRISRIKAQFKTIFQGC